MSEENKEIRLPIQTESVDIVLPEYVDNNDNGKKNNMLKE